LKPLRSNPEDSAARQIHQASEYGAASLVERPIGLGDNGSIIPKPKAMPRTDLWTENQKSSVTL
jgi:hypothetical protein